MVVEARLNEEVKIEYTDISQNIENLTLSCYHVLFRKRIIASMFYPFVLKFNNPKVLYEQIDNKTCSILVSFPLLGEWCVEVKDKKQIVKQFKVMVN